MLLFKFYDLNSNIDLNEPKRHHSRGSARIIQDSDDECDFKSSKAIAGISMQPKATDKTRARCDTQVQDSLAHTKKRVLSPINDTSLIKGTVTDNRNNTKRAKNISTGTSLDGDNASASFSDKSSQSSQKMLREWYCGACTYLNSKRAQKCDMCGR